MGFKTTKNYDKLKVERTAWEKHGGPTGLKAACIFIFFILSCHDLAMNFSKADKKNGVKPLVNPLSPPFGIAIVAQ